MPPPPPPPTTNPNAYFSMIPNNPMPSSTHSDPDADLDSEAAFDLLPLIPHIEQSADTALPARSSPRAQQRNGSGSYNKDGGHGDKSLPFGSTERGLQARGKNYSLGGGGGQAGREWENRQKRDEAVRVLEGGEELVMWVAAARNESIPQTRTHYRNIVLGLDTLADENITWHDEWDMPVAARKQQDEGMGGVPSPARSAKGKDREIASMRKKRVSSGQGHG